MSSIVKPLLAALATLALGACSLDGGPSPAALADSAPPPPAVIMGSAPEVRAPVTILISIDGFRPDYLQRGVTPNLNALAAAGISASMRPSFPSKTFPNHWTLVTGLRPDRTGIVSNTMEDPARPGQTFTMATDDPFWWNAAEPIWVTAERAGIRTGTVFWPGSNVAWGGTTAPFPQNTDGGTRPSDWLQYNMQVTDDQRVGAVIDWLRRPAASRPRFVTLYFDEVDSAGHAYGPSDPRITPSLAHVDAAIGSLVAQLRLIGQPVNLVIVADHGMAAIDASRVIVLDDLLPTASYRLLESGPFAQVYPAAGHEAEVASVLLAPHDHLQCWRRQDIPARFHYGSNPRISPLFCLAEDRWSVEKTRQQYETGGNHGYDNMAPDMAALFIATGPAIRPIGHIADFDNVDIAPLLRDLLGLPAGVALDGDDAPFRRALRR